MNQTIHISSNYVYMEKHEHIQTLWKQLYKFNIMNKYEDEWGYSQSKIWKIQKWMK